MSLNTPLSFREPNDAAPLVPPMTLRDYFAGKALEGILSNYGLFKVMKELKASATAEGIDPQQFESLIEFPAYAAPCYRIADAMLARREQA